MANQTVLELVDRARAIFREKAPVSVLNIKTEFVGWVAEGLESQHSALRYRLGGRKPPIEHPYWFQFFKETTIALVVDQTDYSLPETAGEEFDFIHSLIEVTSGKRLSPYNIEDELAIKRGSSLGIGSGYGRYSFVPGDKIRVLVSPGSFGTPKEVRNLTLRHFRRIKHHVSTADTIDVRPEFTIGPIDWAVYRALESVRVDGRAFLASFRQAANSVPRP